MANISYKPHKSFTIENLKSDANVAKKVLVGTGYKMVVLRGTSKNLEFSSGDSIMSFRSFYSYNGKPFNPISIDVGMLVKGLNSLDKRGEVVIDSVKKNFIVFKSKNKQVLVSCSSSSWMFDFNFFNGSEGKADKSFVFSAKMLKFLINQTAFSCADKRQHRVELESIYFVNRGGKLRAVSSNGSIISIHDTKIKVKDGIKWIIPVRAMRFIDFLLSKGVGMDSVKVESKGKTLYIWAGIYHFKTDLINSGYPDYERVEEGVEKGGAVVSLQIPVKELLDHCEKILEVFNKKSKEDKKDCSVYIKLNIKDKSLSGWTTRYGTRKELGYSSVLPFISRWKEEPDYDEVGVDINFLMGVAARVGDYMRMDLKDSNYKEPIKIVPHNNIEQSLSKYIVMPVRV